MPILGFLFCMGCQAATGFNLRRAGEVLAWGINDFGQLGNGSTFYETSPTKVLGLEDVRVADIVAGGWHSLALTTEGGAHPQIECAKAGKMVSHALF